LDIVEAEKKPANLKKSFVTSIVELNIFYELIHQMPQEFEET